jgi:hypothetical protein
VRRGIALALLAFGVAFAQACGSDDETGGTASGTA